MCWIFALIQNLNTRHWTVAYSLELQDLEKDENKDKVITNDKTQKTNKSHSLTSCNSLQTIQGWTALWIGRCIPSSTRMEEKGLLATGVFYCFSHLSNKIHQPSKKKNHVEKAFLKKFVGLPVLMNITAWKLDGIFYSLQQVRSAE